MQRSQVSSGGDNLVGGSSRASSALLQHTKNSSSSSSSSPFEGEGLITAQMAAQEYELMIHAMVHEHTRDNLDRHVLLLEKWCRDYSSGFYLRDIPYINSVLNILLDRLDIDYGKFRHILTEFLKIMSKPLFEAKANERCRPSARQSIASLYKMVVNFWQLRDPYDIKLGLEICKCFRCITNSGVDPTILKVDIVKWENDGNKMQINEKSYILSILRGGGILDSISSKFAVVLGEFFAEQQLRDDALAKEELKKKQGAAVAAANTGPDAPQADSAAPASSSSLSDGKTLILYTEYVQSMLDLCMELSADDVKCAAHFAHVGIVDTLILLLKDAARSGPRHRRIPQSIDLMWAVLEAYVTMCKSGKEMVALNDLEERDDNTYESPTSLRPSYVAYSLDSKIMNFERSVDVLKEVLLMLIIDGYRLVDKECRNEIIIVLALLLEFRKAFPCFINSDLITIIITYGCAGEMGKNSWAFFCSPLAKFRNFVSSFDIDMQFKREVWMLISALMTNDDPDVLACVASSPILPAMFLYLEQNSIEKSTVSSSNTSVLNNDNSTLLQGSASIMRPENSLSIDSVDSAMLHLLPKQSNQHTSSSNGQHDHDQNITAGSNNNKGSNADVLLDEKNKEEPNIAFLNTLSKSQLKEFQTLAMKFLAQNATKIIGEFVRIRGPRRLLSIISHYCQSSSDPIHKEIVHFGLVLINKCLLCSNIVRKVMEADNAIHIFLYLFANSPEEATRAQAVRLISILCRGGNLMCQNQVKTQNGIQQCIDVLANFAFPKKPIVGTKAGVKFLINPNNEPEDPTADVSGDASVIIVGTLDCIRESVIGNKKSEVKFAKLEGVDVILNLLEVSSFLLRFQVLRLISDLLDNSKLNTFLHAWRSAKTMRSAAQLFAHCWLDEEARLESRRENGVVNNIWDPLGHQSWPVDNNEQHSQFSISSGSLQENRSLVVSNLASAILAARTSVHSVVPMGMKANIMEKDTRGIVASILEKIGLFEESSSGTSPSRAKQQELAENSLRNDSYGDETANEGKSMNDGGSRVMLSTSSLTGDLKMDASDKQVVAIAKRYNLLKEGEWWSSIMEDFQLESLVPIEADMKMVDIRLDNIFDATMAVQLEQMWLDDNALFEKQKQENDYNEQIIVQKNLQIKAEWLKRNGKNKMK